MKPTLRNETPEIDDNGELRAKPSIIQVQTAQISKLYRVISFNNRAMYLVDSDFPHYTPLTRERFDKIAYNILNGPTRSRVGDLFAAISNTAPDLSQNNHYILFGNPRQAENEGMISVWDTKALEVRTTAEVAPEDCVWRSPYGKITPTEGQGRIEFIMQLAGDDEGVYDDIMQSIAPMVMDRKPDGVVWWVGSGANGKSTLMDAIYRCFPEQLASLTVQGLTDGRDAPSLNGNLANIVKESSEGRIDDTEHYKAIGTHDNFSVHKFHSQDSVTILGNMHHIFSANSIPVFNDKGHSATRRTFIIPFDQRFASDPLFEARTFTPEFFGRFVQEICKYAVRIESQGFKYKWSARTLGAKTDYDAEANTAENYARSLVSDGVVGFDNFNVVRMDYENWCRDEAQVPLGVGHMRRALMNAGFERKSVRGSDIIGKGYRIATAIEGELQPLSLNRPGLYTMRGFAVAEVPEFKEETEEVESEW